jgi:hypothetical protein
MVRRTLKPAGAMETRDMFEQNLAEQDSAEYGLGQSRTERGCGTASECIACARRGRIPCSTGRAASIAVIDDKTIAEKTWVG